MKRILFAFLASLLSLYSFSQNDLCSGATALTPGNSCVTTAWTIPQGYGTEITTPSCATSYRDGWFQFTATATSCTVTATNSNRDMGLAIYSGTACAAANFVAGTCVDAVAGIGTETVSFATTIGQVYKIRIMRTNNSGTNSMDGTICVTVPNTPPANDQCAGATSVTCGGSYVGSTNQATSTNDPTGTCGTTGVTPGVWFRFTGTGQIVTASLCGSSYDTKIQVYSGACGAMTCIDGNDDYCSTQSQVTFNSANGTNYYIFVGGFSGATGTYSLSMTCVTPAPPNCSAYTAPANGAILPCVSANLTWNVPATGGAPTQYLLFFGTDAAATNINNGTNIGNVLSYSPPSLLANTTYYWKIVPQNGAGSATGCSTYSFTTGNSVIANDACAGATALISGVTLGDDNSCATDESPLAAGSCWSSGAVNSLWYSINVTGGTLGVLTTGGTLANTQIAVYSGGCASLTEVACNDNAPGAGCGSSTTPNSQLNVAGLANGTYYIRVDGRNALTGSFSIMAATSGSVGTAAPVPGQDCTSPIPFCSNPTSIGNPGYQNTGNICDFGSSGNCTSGEKNAMWLEMTVTTGGNFAFNIIPNDYAGCDNETDYDWVLFKTAGSGATTCANIFSSGGDGEVACNYNYLGVTGMSPSGNTPAGNSSGFPISPGTSCYDASYETSVAAAIGDKFLLVIQNYSSSTSGFSLTIPVGAGIAVISTAAPTQVIWTGGANTNSVTTTTNWGGCAIPNCGLPGADAIVAASAAVQPVVAANLSVKSVTINPGATLTINANVKLDVCGDFVNNGNLVCAPGSTVNFNGTGNQTVAGNLTGANKFSNFMVSKVSGTVNVLNSIEAGQDFFTTSATSIVNTNGVSVYIGRDFRNSNGATTFSGINVNSSLIFNGTGAQVYNPNMNAATPSLTLNHVTMLNTGTGVTISSTNTPNMILGTTGILTLSSGKIITNSQEVEVRNTAIAAVTTGNTSSYVEGNLRRYLAAGATGSFDFPVGHATPGYERANVNFGAAAAAGAIQLTARFDPWGGAFPMPGAPGFGPECSVTYNDPYLNHGYWTINSSATSTGNYTMTLYNRSYSNATSGWSIAKSPSAAPAWALQGTCLGSPVTAVQRLNMSGFSKFSIVQSSVPLPVELIEFNGESKGIFNDVYWRTASERELDHYELESSSDGVLFTKIASRAASGATDRQAFYSYDDYAYYSPITYYRLKMMDQDRSSHYSTIISIENRSQETSVVAVFPNPAGNEVNIQIKAPGQTNATIRLTDMLGKVLIYKQVNLNQSMETVSIDTNVLAEGSYIVTVSYDNGIPVSKKLIISRKN